MERWISALGLFCMIGCAWLLSSHKSRISWRIVVVGLGLQLMLGGALLWNTNRATAFDRRTKNANEESADIANQEGVFSRGIKSAFARFEEYSDEGSRFVFGDVFGEHYFAFKILPTIIFFSALMSILYYVGIIQVLVAAIAWLMQRTLGTSGAESLSAAANIFVGQTEAPLVVRPYVGSMTKSELMAVMVGGFATIAGGVLAAFAGMGINPAHLVTASIISAPAALLVAKVLQPEVEEPKTLGRVKFHVEKTASNLIEAAAQGATDGLKLALNVGAMLIAFIALVALANGILGFVSFGHLSLEIILSYLFFPFAWLMGIPYDECFKAGELLGTKMIVNEFAAYEELGNTVQAENNPFSQRSVAILTFALCGFANFSSIGIQLGGIGAMAENRKSDLAQLGLRAMLGGTLAAFMTACIAGIFI